MIKNLGKLSANGLRLKFLYHNHLFQAIDGKKIIDLFMLSNKSFMFIISCQMWSKNQQLLSIKTSEEYYSVFKFKKRNFNFSFKLTIAH